MNLKKVLQQYISLLHKEEYFEAHELLELEWHRHKKLNTAYTDTLKGLINAAIAFEHIKRDKPKSPRVAKQAISSYDKRYNSNAIFKDVNVVIKSIRQNMSI